MRRGFFNSLLSMPDDDQAAPAQEPQGEPEERLPEAVERQERPPMAETSLFVEVLQEEGQNAFSVAFNAGGVTRDRLHELLGRIENEVEAIDPQAHLDIGIVEALRTRELKVTISGFDAGNALIGLGLVLRRMREGGFATRWGSGVDLTRLQ